VPVLISFSPTEVAGAQALCLVAADLTEQKLNEELLVAERLTRSILEQAGEAILVCDTGGRIIRANQAALRTCPRNPIFKPFESVVPLVCKQPDEAGRCFSIANLLDGVSFQGSRSSSGTGSKPVSC
jgi:transcriptional regulator of acetoin/glycerol metabolism